MSDFAVPVLPTKATTNTELPAPPPLKYEKPSFSGPPLYKYRLEVLKNGASVETIEGPQNKEFVTIGRLPLCDILQEHPSISRYQAVIQFDQDGDAYLYDLGSAHGTKLNKQSIASREYIPLKPGDQLRFGESTRICIFDSEKPFDPEAEAIAKRQAALKQRIAKQRGEVSTAQDEEEGISWGFQEDAVEEDDEDEEAGENTIEDIEANLNKSGDANLLNVEAEKMAIEDAKRRRHDLEIMYNDESDEELYDHTKKKAKKGQKAETHQELLIRQQKTEQQIAVLEKEIQQKKDEEKQAKKQQQEEEDLDQYMQELSKKPNSKNKSLFVMIKELNQLKKDYDLVVKLVKLTKPTF